MQSEQGKEDQEKIEALQNIFPHAEQAQLSAACMEVMGDINKAVDIVLDKVSIDSDDTSEDEELNHPLVTMLLRAQNNKNIDISSIIKSLGKKLNGPFLRVTTDDNLMLSDALVIYKDPGFDASRSLRITFANQPAGGVSWEFFDKV
ncbi:Hypothetical predicted protein [Paramuricea clavata]|uniref:Uncharacterized protein n=1 Tax=Paramuricea clavata TaxID=317549 RepID=A0A6S7HVV3_PARCT|nr:Hypothetical predicted protein [Paramuricea clavata]